VAEHDPTAARFAEQPAAAGFYESFYLKACHPREPLGAWIRYTVHKRPGEEPRASLWFTLFDGAAEGPRASKVTLGRPAAGAEDWIRVGEARMGVGAAAGSAHSERCVADWDLRFAGAEPVLRHLPREWMYRAPLPRTKLVTLLPGARFDGRLTVDGRELSVEGWRGMVGHNWGTQHAERWIWLHGLGFEGASEDSWLDLAIGRVRLGRLTTPWIASGSLGLDGERIRLGGPRRRARVRESPERCDFRLAGEEAALAGTVWAPPKDFVGWVYADPDGSEHHTVNCSIANMRLTLERTSQPPVELSLSAGAAYELGMREHDHGMALQPFPDG
jgi:hypothetical protein